MANDKKYTAPERELLEQIGALKNPELLKRYEKEKKNGKRN